MNSRRVLVFMAALLVAAAVGPGLAAAKPAPYFDFEANLGGWVADTTAESKTLVLERVTEPSDLVSSVGNSYARLTFEPQSTVASAWMYVPIELEQHEDDVVAVYFKMKDAINCAACKIIAYIGAQAPSKADEFGEAIMVAPPMSPVRTDWNLYRYNGRVKADEAIYVAIGFSIPVNSDITYEVDDVMESDAAPPPAPLSVFGVGFDDVNVQISPAP